MDVQPKKPRIGGMHRRMYGVQRKKQGRKGTQKQSTDEKNGRRQHGRTFLAFSFPSICVVSGFLIIK
jgi:hypothetical protein